MKLLFLDVETTGLNPSSSQIIELGACLVEFNPESLKLEILSTFEELVSLRMSMEDKTTRLTGITHQDLATAKKLSTVQENWTQWLQNYQAEVKYIIGHSINFDLAFLNNENWFLPESFGLIDTLEIARILYPDISAINLENLVEKLELQINENQTNSHHRSLFDSKACIQLLQNSLERLTNYHFDSKFYTSFVQNILKLPVTIYSKSIKQNTVDSISKTSSSAKIITWNGELKKLNQTEKIDLLRQVDTNRILDLLEYYYPENIQTKILQTYVIIFFGKAKPNWNLKLHISSNLKEIWIWEVILDYIFDEKKPAETSRKKDTQLYWFESIIWQINSLTRENLEIGKFFEMVSLLEDLLNTYKLEENELSDLSKLNNSYDFFLYQLEPNLLEGKLNIDLQNPDYSLQDLHNRFQELLTNCQEIIAFCSQIKSDLPFVKEITGELSKIKIESFRTGRIYFEKYKNQLKISRYKPNFNLQEHLEKLQTTYPEISSFSYYSQDSLDNFRKLTGLQTNIPIQSLNKTNSGYSYVDHVNLLEFLGNKLELAKSKNKPIMILGGQNSTLRDSQRTLNQNFDKTDYLVLGDMGSLTKIGSKLTRGFVGVLVVKVSSYNFILNLNNCPVFEEIWLLNQPYFFVSKYWYNLANRSTNSEEYITDLKKFYLLSHINKVKALSQTHVGYIRGY